MHTSDFRRYGHEFIDFLSDYFEQIESYPVRSQVNPGDIIKEIPAEAPDGPESMEAVFKDFQSVIMPGISHWQHPGWFAYFPANNSPSSVLAEILTAGLGAQCMIWQTSPAAAELEQRMMEWLASMIGLPAHMQGVIQDTASTATLCALLSAREKASAFRVNNHGYEKTLRVYASSHAHSSIEKGVKIAGYGKENLVIIPVASDYSMDPTALDEAIKSDLSRGLVPACVVASLGTTSTMAMDPIDKIALVCKKYGVWLHVDAAFAGTAAIVPEFRGFMKGVEEADSFVFNPHKWMLTNFDCSAYFVSDAEMLKKTFEIHPEYLKTSADLQVNNYRDWGIQLGRRFRALKLWFVIRTYGVQGIRQMVKSHVGLAEDFEAWLKTVKGYELLAPRNLSLVCFRFNPGGMDQQELNLLNQAILDQVNADGRVYLTHTVLEGSYCLRLAIGQVRTQVHHVALVWQLLQEAVSSLGKSR